PPICGDTMHAVEEERAGRVRVALEQRDEARLIKRAFHNAHCVPGPRNTDQLQLAVVLIGPEEGNGRVRSRTRRRFDERAHGDAEEGVHAVCLMKAQANTSQAFSEYADHRHAIDIDQRDIAPERAERRRSLTPDESATDDRYPTLAHTKMRSQVQRIV